MTPRARLFVALWPDAETRDRLVAERTRWTWSTTARRTPDANLHVTLHFLGDISRDRLPAVIAGLAVSSAPFALSFGRAALWPNGIAAFEPNASPDALHRTLASALERLGLPVEERAYRPHVTLARDARGSTAPPAGAPWPWPVSGYVLVESRGGRYTIVADYPLGKPGQAPEAEAAASAVRSSPPSAGACTTGSTRRS